MKHAPRRILHRYRWVRRLALIAAAAPLFQAAACQTAFNQVGASFINGLPNLIFSTGQSVALGPLQVLIQGLLQSILPGGGMGDGM